MKKVFLMFGLLFSITMFPQVKPNFQKMGKEVKATYYYDNGAVSQEGSFVNGKLQGTWVAFDQNGEKSAEGTYDQGVKVGTWYFWKGDKLSEVTYNDNVIEKVVSYNKTSQVALK